MIVWKKYAQSWWGLSVPASGVAWYTCRMFEFKLSKIIFWLKEELSGFELLRAKPARFISKCVGTFWKFVVWLFFPNHLPFFFCSEVFQCELGRWQNDCNVHFLHCANCTGFSQLMNFQPSYIDADEQVVRHLERICNEIEQERQNFLIRSSTYIPMRSWQHSNECRPNGCSCSSAKYSFCQLQDMELGLLSNERGQEPDTKSKVRIEISDLHTIKGMQNFSHVFGHDKH